MSNATIGMVVCPMSGELAAVRKDKRGAFYLIGVAGRLAPSTDFGQEWFLEHATIWGDGEPPADCPDWIAQGKSYPPLTRSRIQKTKSHNPPPLPVPTPAPKSPAAVEPPARPAPAKPARTGNPWSLLSLGDD